MKTVLILSLILFAGCATMHEVAKEAATLAVEQGEEKLAAIVTENTGKHPSEFETETGGTRWGELIGTGAATIAAYLGWRRVRKFKETVERNGAA